VKQRRQYISLLFEGGEYVGAKFYLKAD